MSLHYFVFCELIIPYLMMLFNPSGITDLSEEFLFPQSPDFQNNTWAFQHFFFHIRLPQPDNGRYMPYSVYSDFPIQVSYLSLSHCLTDRLLHIFRIQCRSDLYEMPLLLQIPDKKQSLPDRFPYVHPNRIFFPANAPHV